MRRWMRLRLDATDMVAVRAQERKKWVCSRRLSANNATDHEIPRLSGLTGPVTPIQIRREWGRSRIGARGSSKLGKSDRRIILLFAEAADRRREEGPGHLVQSSDDLLSHALFIAPFPSFSRSLASSVLFCR